MVIHLKILSWALIFLLRLRFPPGKSIAKIITCTFLLNFFTGISSSGADFKTLFIINPHLNFSVKDKKI